MKKISNEYLTYTSSQIRDLIDERIWGRNAERNREILKRYIVDGITYEKAAEEFQLSVQQIKSIVHKCENMIFR